MIRLIVAISLTFLAACTPQQPEEVPKKSANVHVDAAPFAAQVGIVAYTSLSLASQSAQIMDSKLASFMYHPNPMSQQEIAQAWRQAYDEYLYTLVFSYLPIQDPPD